MSHSAAATTSPSRNWPGMQGKRPSGKQTLVGSVIVIAVALAISLSWLFFWSGSNSFSASSSAQFGIGFNGDSVPAIAHSPAGESSSFGSDQSFSVTVSDGDFRDEAAASKSAGAPFMQATGGSAEVANSIGTRQIISQGSMSVEVTDVPSAATRVRAIAEGVGGFVEQLSSHGVGEFQQSTITVRVPQDEFFSVFEQIKSLGKVQNENAGTEDVTERFIDLEARLKSAQREELSLSSLLEQADEVSEILVIERELARVRTDLERFQGQLNFLERRVDLATITVSLNHPQRDDGRAPSGSLKMETSNVDGSVSAVKAVVSQLNGEVDQVYTSVQDGHQRANMTVRVFADDFNLVVATVESQGGIVSKEIREGAKGDPVSANTDDEEPNARLDIVFAEAEESSNLGRNLAIFIPVGSVALLIVLGLLFNGAYRMGLRKEG